MILEDASGFKGQAEKVLVPASEAELLEIVARSLAQTNPRHHLRAPAPA